jgi:hypothetical protein
LEIQASEGMNTANFNISASAAGKYYLLIDSESETLKALRPWVIKI